VTVTAAALMAAPEVPVEFAIDGLVPHGLSVLAGAPKTGKSYFALQAAIAVAQGEPFLGRRTLQGDVLYLALEDGPQRIQRRLHQLAASHGDLDRITFQFQADPLHAGLEGDLDAWYESVDCPRFVVIDTFGRIDPGQARGQSEYSHVTSMLGPLQQWALTRKVAVVLLHHLRKLGAGEIQAVDVFERILGSQGMLGIADAAFVMLRGRREHTAELHVTSRDFEEDAVALAIDTETMRWSATKLREDPLARFTDRRREIVEILMAGPMRLKDIANCLATTDSNAIQHLEKAVRDNVVVKVRRGVYALEESLAEELVPAEDDGAGEGPELDEDAQVLDFTDLSPADEEFDFS
jgi:hypothetical protein